MTGNPKRSALTWTRGPQSAPWWDADSGHRVLAFRRGDAWAYMALGPDLAAGWNYRAWSNGLAPHWSGREPRVYYARGEAIPEPRAYLGIFDTADAARAACARDVETQQ